jgi:hypothetical protein
VAVTRFLCVKITMLPQLVARTAGNIGIVFSHLSFTKRSRASIVGFPVSVLSHFIHLVLPWRWITPHGPLKRPRVSEAKSEPERGRDGIGARGPPKGERLPLRSVLLTFKA